MIKVKILVSFFFFRLQTLNCLAIWNLSRYELWNIYNKTDSHVCDATNLTQQGEMVFRDAVRNENYINVTFWGTTGHWILLWLQ